MVDIDQLELLYFQNDLPCPYKLKNGDILKIYPVKVKDWAIFESSLSVLKIPKNETNDINIIQMSYLKYLIEIIFRKEEIMREAFANIFYYSLKEDNISVAINQGKAYVILSDNKIISSKEFDEISKIILFQNIKDYDDRYVNPDVKELMNEYYAIKYKDSRVPTLEEKKTYVISKTGINILQLNEMSYRMFSQVYQHSIDDILYLGQKIIQASYKYDVKENVVHPLYEKEKDKYEEIFTSTSTLAEKGIMGAESLNALNNKR